MRTTGPPATATTTTCRRTSCAGTAGCSWSSNRNEGRLMRDDTRTGDLVELHALCARYMLLCGQFIQDRWLEVFTPDGGYNAFGTEYDLSRFPALLAAA